MNIFTILLLALSLAHAGVAAASPYETLMITQPDQNRAFWSAPGEVTILVYVKPALERGHEIQVYLDEEPVGKGTKVELVNIDRGNHLTHAEVLDANGKVLIRSPVVHFTLHRPSILLPPDTIRPDRPQPAP